MTSIQQRAAQSVPAGIDDLLPQLRQRARAAEDLRRITDQTGRHLDGAWFFELLQPEQRGGLHTAPPAEL